jgi:hypothetical protein
MLQLTQPNATANATSAANATSPMNETSAANAPTTRMPPAQTPNVSKQHDHHDDHHDDHHRHLDDYHLWFLHLCIPVLHVTLPIFVPIRFIVTLPLFSRWLLYRYERDGGQCNQR